MNVDHKDGNVSVQFEKNKLRRSENGMSWYLKKTKFHITAVKWITLAILIDTGIVPGYVLLSHQPCGREANKTPSLIGSACQFMKQLPIQENVYVTVCNQMSHSTIDIRKFIGRNATAVGIQLTEKQWIDLQLTVNDFMYLIN